MRRFAYPYRSVFVVGLALLGGKPLIAQNDSLPASPEPKKIQFGGYLKDLQSVQFTDISKKWSLDNLIHNRMDIFGYPSSDWSWQLGIRNRFFYGESVPALRQNESVLTSGDGLLKLNAVIADGESFLLHTAIDRAWVDFHKNQWQVTIGRQRINWGVNLVWNPNDIFNAYNYFDFDYEERPGTDAIRIQHYLGSTSSVELAAKPGKHPNETIIAGLYRFTAGKFDWQGMAGLYDSDWVAGLGWSGSLGGAGFNGELSGFIPRHGGDSQRASLSASLGGNYTFPNSLYLHAAYLYNSAGEAKPDSGQASYLFQQVSAKMLSPSVHSLFGEAAFQFTPLIRGDLAAIVNPADGSFFAGPFATFSLSNSTEFLAGGQLFFGRKGTLYGDYGSAVYLRFKWSF